MAATYRNTVFEVKLKALAHNYTFFSKQIAQKTKIMAVVKAFAYGHGAIAISKKLTQLQADYLAVAFIDEGVELVKNGIELPILIFNPNPEEFKAIVEYKLEPAVYNLDFLNEFIVFLKSKGIKNYPIHLKLDTGMHRSGFTAEAINNVLPLLQTNTVSVKSIFSHLAASEDENEKAFTLKQIALFKTLSEQLTIMLPYAPLLHILNSSGITNYPEAQFDMVRLGISLYGSSPLPKIQEQLQAVGSLKSVITQQRTIEQGETVSYNRKFKAQQKTVVATVPIGYADGINRHYGNSNGQVLVRKQLVPIIGTICMDSLMLDVTNIDAQIGDIVLFFGANYPVEKVAKQLNTITYEIFTSVSKRVKRCYIE